MRVLFIAVALLGLLWNCTPQPVAATTTAQPTRKLCLPSNTVVSYSSACPAGTTSVKKICPYGQIVSYSTACPTSPPPPPPPPAPLTYGGKASAQLACQSQLYNPDYTTVIGASYTVVGFGHINPIGTVNIASTVRDIVVLNDSTHKGDGYRGIWVPIGCVVGQ